MILDGISLDTLVLASGNRNKFNEFRELLLPMGVTLKFGGDFDDPIEVDESGGTFTENAALKAVAWARETGLPAIADDSGIEVRALDYRPGIHSARIAPGDEACRQWLIGEMKDKEDTFARYAVALVLAFPDGRIAWQTLAYCNGHVVLTPRGENGFGYDPLFVPEGYDCTFGELSSSVKAEISHRAKATAEFIAMLKELPR